MCCKIFWKRVIPFSIALLIGLLAVSILQKAKVTQENQESAKQHSNIKIEKSFGCGGCSKQFPRRNDFGANYVDKSLKSDDSIEKKLEIISKPRANYTESARINNAQGSVNLRVTFLANGTVGSVSPITELPYGLTEQCIIAAKQITFEPMIKDGKPISTTKVVQYSFTIY